MLCWMVVIRDDACVNEVRWPHRNTSMNSEEFVFTNDMADRNARRRPRAQPFARNVDKFVEGVKRKGWISNGRYQRICL